MMTLDQFGYDQYHSDDRVFVFHTIEGMEKLAANGLVDQRLFNGENKLHAKKEPETGLWYLQYDKGGLPPVLKQKWTSMKAMKTAAIEYFRKRGLMITEVEDEPKDSHYRGL